MTPEPENVTVSSPQGAGDTLTKPTKPADETRLAVLADLLADLPEVDRRELIADLSPADRVAIARRLIGSVEQTAFDCSRDVRQPTDKTDRTQRREQ